MEKTIKIRSSFLSVLNEALQKLTLNDTVKNFTPVIVEADGKFTSVVKTEDEFDPSVLGANIDTEEDETENDIQKKETREQLLNKAKDAMQQTIDSSSNLKDILKKIEELSKSDDNKWQLNKEHNTASLPSRNTYIFKQNNNLCVSHKGKIELFKSVEELRKWLKDNKYPLPDDSIVIHESVDIKEHIKGDAGSSDYFGKHGNNGRNWVDLYYQYKERDIQNSEANHNKNLGILDDKKYQSNAEIIANFEDIRKKAIDGKNTLVAKINSLKTAIEDCDNEERELLKKMEKLADEISNLTVKVQLGVAEDKEKQELDEKNKKYDELKEEIKEIRGVTETIRNENGVKEKKIIEKGYKRDCIEKLEDAEAELDDYCNNDPTYLKYLSFLGKDGYIKDKKYLNAYSANKQHDNAVSKLSKHDSDEMRGLSKRVSDEVYKADMHKKDEPVVSDKYLNFDDEMDECCGGIGGGITSVANLGPFVQHVANKVKKKKEEEKEALEEALEEAGNFPDFDPQNGTNIRDQAGKVAEKFINSLIKDSSKIKDLKDGKFAPLPFTKEEYFDVLQSTYYDYAKTHVGNSNWPKKVKETLREEASDLLNKFQNQELDPTENEIVSNFIQVYQETKSQEEITTEGLVNDLALALNDLFRKNNPQFAGFNQKLAAKLTNALNRDFGEIKVEIKPGDVLLYGKDIIDDTENPDSRAVLYKLNKHIRNEKDENDDGGSLEARKQWNVENFKIYMEKRNISNVLKALYDAVYSPDSKAKFSKQNDSYVDSWKAKWKKDKGEYIKLLTDEEIEEIKASWNQAKAEIKQEEPTVEPTPQEIKAEIEQEDVLTDKEQEILNTLMSINRSLDPTKYTTSQLREMIKTVMGLGKTKQESIYESAMKHPWLNKLMGKRLVEDDSPADFATGSPISSDMDSATASADTSSTTTDTSSTSTPDIDIGGGAAPATPNGFGDVDISVGGYDPEGEGDEGGVPAPNAPEYDIVDVLANTDDPTDIKVKIKNSETGEVEIKDLSEI